MLLKNIQKEIELSNLENAFNLIIENEPILSNNSNYWILRGNLCSIIGEIESAVYCYEKAFNINPYNSLAVNNLLQLIDNYSIEYDRDSLNSLINEINNNKKLLAINNFITNFSLNKNNASIVNNSLFNNKFNLYYYNELLIGENEVFSILEHKKYLNNKYKIIVPLNNNYVDNIKMLSKFGATTCDVTFIENGEIKFVNVSKNIMSNLKNNINEKTIVFHYSNRGDSNVYALHKLMPQELKKKYNTILLKGYSAYSTESKILVPLTAKLSIAGQSTFLGYPIPELMINIEVGHGPMPIKGCGELDKVPGFAFLKEHYKHVNKLCTSSNLDEIIWMASAGLSKEQSLISGCPRTDLLHSSNGKANLEKLLNIKLKNKKVILNMPTFHNHMGTGTINGNKDLDGFIKIPNFNYKEFDKFLEENNYICIFKVHHCEENIISQNNKFKNSKNIFTISNDDLERKNIDLYEIVNGADLLITDYSSIYSDFIYMNKPVVFTNCDLEEYRENRGLTLEPYEYWTAGPKVQEQTSLQEEIIKSINCEDYYKSERTSLQNVFFKYLDGKASNRVWEYINTIF